MTHKKFFLSVWLLLGAVMVGSLLNTSFAQQGGPRASLKASVSQTLGVDTQISIEYSRPGVKGRTIWGDLVPYGLAPGNRWSKDKPFPWRAGANENTTIEFSHDVMIEGQALNAGKYGLHMIPSKEKWIIVFSGKNGEWGSFSYDDRSDALRVTVDTQAAPSEEWLRYGFENLAGTSATAYLHWEKLKVAFRIEMPGPK